MLHHTRRQEQGAHVWPRWPSNGPNTGGIRVSNPGQGKSFLRRVNVNGKAERFCLSGRLLRTAASGGETPQFGTEYQPGDTVQKEIQDIDGLGEFPGQQQLPFLPDMGLRGQGSQGQGQCDHSDDEQGKSVQPAGGTVEKGHGWVTCCRVHARVSVPGNGIPG